MAIDLRSVGGYTARLAWVGLRSFAGSVIVLTLLGGLLAGLSYAFLREHYWGYAAMAATLALVEAVILGFVIGAKRAMVMIATHALGTLRLGQMLVRLVFERMLRVGRDAEEGGRGERIAQGLGRLPLARAEEALNGAVRSVTGEAQQAGWLRRKLQSRLLEAVRKYTLARFRTEESQHGGIDLPKVKDELERTIDDALVRKVRGSLWIWTALAAIVLPLVVALQTWLIHRLLLSMS
jgi:hypothetical protein